MQAEGGRGITANQIVGALREAEVGLARARTVPKVVRKRGVTEQTSYRGKREYGVPGWPTLLVNLCAGRETELMLQNSAHVVHGRTGSSREVTEDHYLGRQESSLEKTSRIPRVGEGYGWLDSL